VTIDTVEVGADTWVQMPDVKRFIVGQKIDFDGPNGVTITKEGKKVPLKGTFLVEKIDEAAHKLALMDVVERKPIASTGAYVAEKSKVSTYALVGPQYFNFYAGLITIVGVLFIGVAILYKEKNHYREEGEGAV
jgi:POT family proton-dependent oligopeptide transporter